MEYLIYRWSSGETLDTVELHVLARAYRAAWRSQFSSDPVGAHKLYALDVMLVFSAKAPDSGT